MSPLPLDINSYNKNKIEAVDCEISVKIFDIVLDLNYGKLPLKFQP